MARFGSLLGWTVACGFAALASCGGVSERRVLGDDDVGGEATTGGADAGGTVGRGGTSAGGTSAGGNVGKGGGGYGGGGRGGTAGTLPDAGASGLGATSGRGGTGGEGDFGGAAGEPGCRFEALAMGYRCENAGSRVQDDTSIRTGAGTLSQCEDRCLANPACTAITDYFSESGPALCRIVRGNCGDFVPNPEGEEDAGKHYRKVCDAFGCRLEYLGHWMHCSGYGEEYRGATSRADCDRACLADSECTAVIDYFWIDEIVGCYLYTSTCDDPEPLPVGDSGKTFVWTCD